MLTVREMARGLAVGEARGGLLCPRCHGGRSGERSLSLYRTAEGIGAKCHRASCPLNVFRPDLTGPASAPAMFKPRPYPWPLELPGPGAEIWDRLRLPAAERGPEQAARLGVLARAGDSNEVVWQVRDYDWSARGHISRTYPDKRIRVWREAEGPFYGYHGFKRRRELWIVEDMVSAAQIAIAGGNALALLGTHFSKDGQALLGQYLARLPRDPPPRIRVALDPDAAHKALALTRELTSRLGYATITELLGADPKDLEPGKLAKLVQDGLT